MPTVLALFETRPAAEHAIASLSFNGFGPKDVSVVLFAAKPGEPPRWFNLLGWLSRGYDGPFRWHQRP